MADVNGIRGSLQARLDELAAEHGLVGASAAVLVGDEVIEAVTGVANLNTGAPVRPATIFQIGSISKLFTATLVMQLLDEGLITLDEPVRTYLPELRLADPDALERITIRQILSHTSGMDGDVFDDFGRGDDCLEKFVAAMADLQQTNEPGAFFSYCNTGYTLLGRLIEVVRGTTWDAALRTHLLDPLGLTDVVTLPDEAILRDNAVGHLPLGEDGAPQVAPVWFMSRSAGPAGVITGSARDLLTFVRMHLDDGSAPDGTQILSPASAKLMRELQVMQPEPSTLGEGWGLGWILYKLGTDGGPAVSGHDGATIGQQAYCRVVPDQGFAAVLLTNGPAGGGLFNELIRPLLREQTGGELVPPCTPPSEPVQVDITPFLGTYERSGSRIIVRRGDDGGLELEIVPTGPLADIVPPEPAKALAVLDETRLITAEPEERLGMHLVIKFLGAGPDGFGHLHMGGRGTPRVSGAGS